MRRHDCGLGPAAARRSRAGSRGAAAVFEIRQRGFGPGYRNLSAAAKLPLLRSKPQLQTLTLEHAYTVSESGYGFPPGWSIAPPGSPRGARTLCPLPPLEDSMRAPAPADAPAAAARTAPESWRSSSRPKIILPAGV